MNKFPINSLLKLHEALMICTKQCISIERTDNCVMPGSCGLRSCGAPQSRANLPHPRTTRVTPTIPPNKRDVMALKQLQLLTVLANIVTQYATAEKCIVNIRFCIYSACIYKAVCRRLYTYVSVYIVYVYIKLCVDTRTYMSRQFCLQITCYMH